MYNEVYNDIIKKLKYTANEQHEKGENNESL